ncbi:MAG: alpha/beta fold hydrolase [Dehalococcoidia bacterium]
MREPAPMEQDIRFCTAADGVRLAYATSGEGYPIVKSANWLNHLEFDWQSPPFGHFLRGLSEHSTLIRYDERGTGLSDRDVDDMSFESWVSDLETVVDATGLERFALLGISQGGPVAVAYAVRHPERVSHLLLYGSYPKFRTPRTEEQAEELEAFLLLMGRSWGRNNPAFRQMFTTYFVPGASAEQMRAFNYMQRESASPANAVRIYRTFTTMDVREIAPMVRAPTLIFHRRRDGAVPFRLGRELASLIPGARFVPLEGENHLILEGEPEREVLMREIWNFLGIETQGAALGEHSSSLVTILFTDMEGSTSLTQSLGDARAQELLRDHNAIVRDSLKAHGGTEIKHTGDGIMASFPSASRAIECAIAIQGAFTERNAALSARPEPVEGRGAAHGSTLRLDSGQAGSPRAPSDAIRVRIGLNAGEPVAEDEDLFGTAVQLAARVCAKAEPGEILTSNVVRELAAGKGFLFSDRGDEALRGFEDPVRLYEVRWAD